jgi:hypothetical protein
MTGYLTFCWMRRMCSSNRIYAAGRNLASVCAHVIERMVVLWVSFSRSVPSALDTSVAFGSFCETHALLSLINVCKGLLVVHRVRSLAGVGAIVTPVRLPFALGTHRKESTQRQQHTSPPTPHRSAVRSPTSRSRMQNLPARVSSMPITG